MDAKEIVKVFREHPEWAQANEWERPITLGDVLRKAAQPSEKPEPLTCEGCLYFDDDMEHAFALCRECKRSVQVYDFYRSKPKEEV